ncbi:MAG: ABC transporter ATP-binding protein/permease [Thermoanaerobaculia bacterium]|nr:ABC transporter ATP-binding protein/permease [Thermoanaerobaculia bacterium]
MMLRPRLVRLIAEAPVRIGAVVAAGLAGLGLSVMQGWLGARALDRILGGEPWPVIIPVLLAIGALIGVRAALRVARDAASASAAGIVKRRLRGRLYRHLLRLGPGFLATRESGSLQATLVDAVEALEGYLGAYLPQALVTLAGTPMVVAFLFVVDPPVAGVVVAAWLASLTVPPLWELLLGEHGRQHWRAYTDLAATFLDSLRGMSVLKAYGASRRRGGELHDKALTLYRETMAQLSISMLRSGWSHLATGIGTTLAIGYGALRVVSGELSLTDLLLLLFLCGICFEPLRELETLWHRGYAGVTAEPYLFALLDTEPQIDERVGAPSRVFRLAPEVRFEHVSFSYQPERQALQDVSFTIAAGERVAVVGPSGAGKSTVVALLLRFFDPQSGRITLDEHDVRDLRLTDLRRATAWVSQDTFLFAGSLLSNLTLGRPDASREAVADAIRAAALDDFVARQPKGLDTEVGEHGSTLSGGERQRLAIARALIKDAPLLLLDEATSAVDGAGEAVIQDALARLSEGRTTLIVAHRLSTVRDADRVLVLDNGRLAEVGTHHDLRSRDQVYARLVAAHDAMLEGVSP